MPKSKKEPNPEETPDDQLNPSSREEKLRKQKEKERKLEEKDRQKRIYITMMVGAMFVYLNFAKNPFNK